MNDLRILAALRHVTQTAPDPGSLALLIGTRVTFALGEARIEREGQVVAFLSLGDVCARFRSVPLILTGRNLPRPVFWRAIPLRVLDVSIEDLAIEELAG